jgi:hypothetical protein
VNELPEPLREVLWPFPLPARGVYALVDAAQDAELYPAIRECDADWVCLYRGDAAVRLAEAAPYLVELHPDSRFTRWFLERGWGRQWGVFLTSNATIERLQGHFRRCTMAELPDGRHVFFRFYDPRVLRVYLPVCTPEELETIFGPAESFVMEAEDPATAIVFTRDGETLQRTECTLGREVRA